MSVNSINQYTQVNTQALTYDLNGNLTDDGERTLTYDPANRLAAASYAGSNSSYQFDAFNRRVAKTVDGQKTWFIHDGHEVIAEYSNTGNLEAEYIAGAGLDEWLVLDNSIGRYYYAEDGLGSTRYLTDSAGNVVEQYEYDPYGKVSIFGPTGAERLFSDVANPYLYTGRRLDAETGLYHYRNRGYHPELGRFLQRDPLGYFDSLNLYSYVVNNPVNWVDPFGEQTLTDVFFWVTVVYLGGQAAYEAGQAWNRNPPSWPDWPDWFPGTQTDTSGGWNFCPVQNQKDEGEGDSKEQKGSEPKADQPTKKDGYKPPKNWDGKKRKNPNGPGSGYPDDKGNVWVPTDHKGTHAPHWDVQHPGGRHTPVYPKSN